MTPRTIRSFCLLLALWACSAALSAAPCAPSATALCLSGQRFHVEVQWKDFQGNTGAGQAISLTGDTGYFWFFSSSNVELVVKALDGRALNNKFWVFFGALSNVQYDMTVTDTVTGASKAYHNPSGQFASVGDTSAFDGGAGAVATRETATAVGTETPPESLAAIQYFVNTSVPAGPAPTAAKAASDFTPCLAPVTELLLNNCRFHLHVTWQDSQGNTGDGQAIQLTNDTGYFWFFSPNNVELVVKVLDGRALNGDFWVFFGALSNVQYRLTVTDMITGDVKTYTNPQGSFASVGDTSAFQPVPSMSVVRDDAHAVSDRFDRTGGTLTATGADGTTFVLTLPEDAIVLPERITMTPVSQVNGLPISGPLQAAVQIEPDGLFLWQPADLKILPPATASLRVLTYFRYQGPGESFTPYPGVVGSTNVDMSISFLAGYGAAAGTASTLSPKSARRVESAAGLTPYIAQVADLFRQLANLEIDEDTYLTKVYEVWGDAYGDVVLPALAGLDKNCDLETLKSVIRLAWEFRTKDPFTDPTWYLYNDAIFASIKTSALNCIEASYKRCKANNDPSEVMFMLSLQRLLQIQGLIDDDENQEITNDIHLCLTFEVDFESGLSFQLGGLATEQLKVRAVVPVYLEPIDNKYILSGEAAISYEFADVEGGICTYSVATKPGTFTVDRLDVGVFADYVQMTRADIDFDMGFRLGDPEENVTQTCPFIGTVPGEFERLFQTFYSLFHKDEFVPDDLYLVYHWTPIRAGNFFAKRDYERTLSLAGGPASEETHIFIKHTPQ